MAPSSEARPPFYKVLILATRPNTLALSFTPVAVGWAIETTKATETALGPAMAFWLFACMIQIGTNLHNDYADFVKGADTKDRLGQARATQKGWLTAAQTAALSLAALAMATVLGASLALRDGCGWFMGLVTATSVFNAVAYTGGPVPLGYVGLGGISIGYSGLGDIFVMAYFGYVATIAPFVLRHPRAALPPELLLAATALGALATAVLAVNNLRDRTTDVLVGKKTLAVRFGATFVKLQYLGLVVVAYGGLVVAVVTGLASTAWLLPWASAPLAASQLRAVWTKDGAALNAHVGGTAKLQLVFGLLLAVAILFGPRGTLPP